jgi:hypothetical protein
MFIVLCVSCIYVNLMLLGTDAVLHLICRVCSVTNLSIVDLSVYGVFKIVVLGFFFLVDSLRKSEDY